VIEKIQPFTKQRISSNEFSKRHCDLTLRVVLLAIFMKMHNIVKIDSISWSFCLSHICKMVYLVKDLKRNKHQLLHRITRVRTPLMYNNNDNKNFVSQIKVKL